MFYKQGVACLRAVSRREGPRPRTGRVLLLPRSADDLMGAADPAHVFVQSSFLQKTKRASYFAVSLSKCGFDSG